MITKYEVTKSLLFDGDEADAVHKTFNLPAGDIKFSDFANNNFEDLQKILTPDDFKVIVKTAGFSTGGFLNLYQGSERLRLYYAKKGDTIIVFAYGEFQPTRYKLYLEGVWAL
ncbi:hypothetical protein SAMN05192574_106271 [Mucilaginibacter gossypiicola]|uniref:Uncharacterized protein n=1 Tax=Mucilaginibacter gossypiicola TaxID=551995 RepID=A0A1H8N690_9SPHI|nr:hypothetical protein [Mucilaginibacter gossypiicola]SEO25125.1 hypothetical protein SAMN05192574_106271 [Mucilaginibacter gossypiicola]